MTANHQEALHHLTLKMKKNLLKVKLRKVRIKMNRKKLEGSKSMKGSPKHKESIK